MTERVLTRVELNRTLLARQLLLRRKRMPAARAVEQLAGLQAQYPPSPYLSLHARLEGIERDTVTRAIERRKLVKALLMRGTLHLVTPQDFWAFAKARRALGADYWPPAYERLISRERISELAEETLRELRAGPVRYESIRSHLEPHVTEKISPAFLWRRIQGQADVVHVAPSGTWSYHGDGVYQAADAAIAGATPSPDEASEHLVLRYLRGFGPATKHDVAQWAGIQRIGPVAAVVDRLDLRTFRDEQGRALYDVPGARLVSEEAPAPPRLVPRFDNLVLSHADRTRVLGDVPVGRIVTKNAIVHATILVDGFVAGTWQLEKGRVVLEPFAPLSRATRAALRDEADRVETFVA